MTIPERVHRTRLGLGAIVVVTAILWGLSAGVFVSIAAATANALVGLPQSALDSIRALALLAGAATASRLLWRTRFAWMFDRVALWIEERAPELRYSLVTAADARYAASIGPVADPLMEHVDTGAFLRRAALRSVTPAVGAVALAVGLSAIVPARWKEPIPGPGGNRFGNATAAALLAGSRLTPLSATIVPPQYSHLESERAGDPTTIAGIRGSRVVLDGRGSSRGLSAQLVTADRRHISLPVRGEGNAWSVSLVMTDTTPAVLELTDGGYRRAIVLNPHADAPPVVRIRLPARDTALRAASGGLQLTADLSDDIGLGAAEFEYIISSGSEETFSFKQGAIGGTRFSGERSGRLSISVPYSFFKLGEGDRLSVRAVAADLNSLNGPGKGFSETRTIRIVRKDEYDSLSVEAAAPSGDTAMLSLRMLIIETERLEAQRPKLIRDTLVARSRGLARQTDQVRAAVLPLFRDEGGDAPEVTIDTESTERSVEVVGKVREALNDLEDASRRLDVADPHSALPPMYKAYRALESFRKFKRYYLRGATRPVIVDIQRVRLTGKTKGRAAPMSARSVATSDRDRMRTEYSAAIAQLQGAPAKGVTMLTMLRVASLQKYPALSAAIESALSAIGRGQDATGALLKVRRLLESEHTANDSLPLWSGGW